MPNPRFDRRVAIVCTLALAACAAQAQEVARGIAEFHRGEYAAAAATLRQAPASAQRDVFLALATAATGGCEAARPDLARQFEQAPDAELRRLSGLGLARCLMSLNHGAEAFPILERLRAVFPNDADVLYLTARFHMQAWNDTVYEMFRRTPASFRVNQLSAEILEIQGKHSDAAAEYRKAIEKNPAALDLHFRLGRALLLESHAPGNLAAARREFEAELALNASDAAAEYEIGQILLAQQNGAEAARRFEHALAASPDFAEALLALARCKSEARAFNDAIPLLERAVRLQPRNESAHYSLMMAYRNAGRREEAAREKAALEKLQPPEGEFTNFLKRLGQGTSK